MTDYFDGKLYAQKKEEALKLKVDSLRNKGIIPKLVSIIIGDNAGSMLYQNLKKKAAERVGAELEIINLQKFIKTEILKNMIEKLNNNPGIHGIMIQLPLPENFSKEDRDELIKTIKNEKDVDGLREDSLFTAPVVKAVMDTIPDKDTSLSVAVVGAQGFEGRKIVSKLKKTGFIKINEIGKTGTNLESVLPQSDIVISSTGQPDLIKAEMVKKGVVLIDVGSPKGDISKDCYDKASYVTPVPGGIGPATIVNLIENLTTASIEEI